MAKFSKKHYEVIAQALFELEHEDSIMIKARKKLIQIFKEDNPGFNENEFHDYMSKLEDK